MFFGYYGVFGHTSVARETDGFAPGTQLRRTGVTNFTAATALHRDRHYPVSRAYSTHALADLFDDAGELVTQRHRRLDPLEPGVRSKSMNVTAANATVGYSKQHIA
jgi:hypothetical protein